MLSSDWEPRGTIRIPLSLGFLHETPPVYISDVEHSLGLPGTMLGKPCSTPPTPISRALAVARTADGIP